MSCKVNKSVMIFIIRALSHVRKKEKEKAKKKEKAQKKERKREKGQCYYPFSTLCFKVAP